MTGAPAPFPDLARPQQTYSMNPLHTDAVIASMGIQYNPQGPLASSYISLFLWLVAAVSVAVFAVRIMRRRNQPPRSFTLECVLAFVPVLCATAYLVLGVFRILEISSRVQVSHQLLQQRISNDIRPLWASLFASALMFLLVRLLMFHKRGAD